MDKIDILNKIKSVKRGCYFGFTKSKDLGNGVVKESDMRIRLGCAYSNLSINKDVVTGELPWGHWVEGLENYVIEHTKKDKKTGEEETNYYLRITSCTPENPESGADVIDTRYFKDGIQITKEEAKAICDPKAFESHASAVYNIKFSNIVKC